MTSRKILVDIHRQLFSRSVIIEVNEVSVFIRREAQKPFGSFSPRQNSISVLLQPPKCWHCRHETPYPASGTDFWKWSYSWLGRIAHFWGSRAVCGVRKCLSYRHRAPQVSCDWEGGWSAWLRSLGLSTLPVLLKAWPWLPAPRDGRV